MEAHATFFWGKNRGSGLIVYVLDLVSVFLISLLVEWLSHSRFISSETNNVVAGLKQTGLYSIRITLAYLVMLKVMSFDVLVLLLAVAGYSLGFLFFGSRVFHESKSASYQKPSVSDLPPLNC